MVRGTDGRVLVCLLAPGVVLVEEEGALPTPTEYVASQQSVGFVSVHTCWAFAAPGTQEENKL